MAVAAFKSREDANRAVDDLQRAGFSRDNIGVVARDTDGKEGARHTADDASHAGEGAAIGAAAGAGVGALVSLGMSFGMIPLIGPVLAVGTLGAALLSAIGGAAAGGLAGGLIGWGIPEEEAKYFEGEVHAGHYLVTVRAGGRYDEALKILERCGGYSRDPAGRTSAPATAATGTAAPHMVTPGMAAPAGAAPAASTPGMTGATAPRSAAQPTRQDQSRMQLKEEELHARKEAVEAGEVKLRKEVTTEHKTIDVPVKREEVVIERHPATGQRASGGDIQPGEEIRIPVKEEQVHLEKTPVVKEEVSVGKRTVQDTEQVSGTVRKEHLKVEETGDAKVEGTVPKSKKPK